MAAAVSFQEQEIASELSSDHERPSGVFPVAQVHDPFPRTRMRWTEHERGVVRVGWAHVPLADIAARLGRTEMSVYREATQALGLGGGCPQGFEYINTAAERTGFHRRTILKILHWAGVKIRMPAMKPSTSGARGDRIVDKYDVDEAVKEWCATETLADAARRYGYGPRLIESMLRAAAGRGEIKMPRHAPGTQWRVRSDDVDKAMEDYIGREDMADAAKRHGVSSPTMRGWLREAGVQWDPSMPNRWLDPDFVDAMVVRRKHKDTLLSASARHHINPRTLAKWLGYEKIAIGAGSPWLDPKVADEVVRKWTTNEDIRAAAKRHNLAPSTLRSWLKLEGVTKTTDARNWLEPAVVDRVVATMRSREDITAAAKRYGVSVPTMAKWLRAANVERPAAHAAKWLDRDVTDAAVALRRWGGGEGKVPRPIAGYGRGEPEMFESMRNHTDQGATE